MRLYYCQNFYWAKSFVSDNIYKSGNVMKLRMVIKYAIFKIYLHICFRCIHEYMDVYAEIQSHDSAELVNSPFGGRYCGHIPPRPRVSLYRALALGFFTDRNSTTPELFTGRYTFINDCECIIVEMLLVVAWLSQYTTGKILKPLGVKVYLFIQSTFRV